MIKTWMALGCLTLIGFSPKGLAETHEGAPLFLAVGEQRILPFSRIYRFSVSGGESLRYLRIPNEEKILLKALKPGLATLYVATSSSDSETHRIRIEAKPSSPYPIAFLEALNSIKTTEVVNGGDRFFLRGTLSSPNEAQAVANLKDHFPTYVVDQTMRSPSDLEHLFSSIQSLLKNYPTLTLQNEAGSLFIYGGVPSLALKESLTKQIHIIDPLAQIEIQTAKDADPTLFFKVFLLEVKKELITSLGIEWPPSHPASLNLNSGNFLVGDSMDLTIHALSQKGLVRVLSSPELVVKAPGQAELFAGGELPIRERSRFSDNILWKNIGLSLKLDVKEYSGEKVRISIETEMSHLDSALTNDQIPGIQTNRIKTLVDGTLGKPLLLSGLLQEDLRSSSKGLPMLSKLPVLGALFSSEDYQKSRSEFVAILLPGRNLPSHPLVRISGDFPKGFLPIPRNYLNEEDKETLKASEDYPWNAL